MGELGDLYAEGRNRIIEVVDGIDEATAATTVPTCPAWSVRDVLAHVAGIPADIIAGRLDGVATEAWTQAQVDARRDRSVEEIVTEWRETGPQVDAIIDQFGRSGEQLLTDLTTHEHDLRLALGMPGARDARVLDVAARFVVESGLDHAIRERALGPLRVDADHLSFTAGGDAPAAATLTTSRFEVMRAYTGRRSAAQVAAMRWSVDPAPYLAIFGSGLFAASAADVIE